MMRFATALHEGLGVEAVAESLAATLGGDPDLVLWFATPDQDVAEAARRWGERAPGAAIAGCLGAGVLASGREAERGPAVAAFGARWPGVSARVVHLDGDVVAGPADAARALLGDEALAGLLLLADPFSLDIAPTLRALDAARPGLPVFGALASGGQVGRKQPLFLRDRVVQGGAVGVAISGSVAIDVQVSTGCRPVGSPLFVTAAEGAVLRELDGRPVLEALREALGALPEGDRAATSAGLWLGVQMRDQDHYDRGDFLVRHIHGATPDGRGLVVGATIPRFAVVQLHVRDAATSRDDLVGRLSSAPRADAALLFRCVSRGPAWFGAPDHDIRCVRDVWPDAPVAGFCANGEIGPVHGSTHLHGYTSVVASFRER